jgi:hypothetical protein
VKFESIGNQFGIMSLQPQRSGQLRFLGLSELIRHKHVSSAVDAAIFLEALTPPVALRRRAANKDAILKEARER